MIILSGFHCTTSVKSNVKPIKNFLTFSGLRRRGGRIWQLRRWFRLRADTSQLRIWHFDPSSCRQLWSLLLRNQRRTGRLHLNRSFHPVDTWKYFTIKTDKFLHQDNTTKKCWFLWYHKYLCTTAFFLLYENDFSIECSRFYWMIFVLMKLNVIQTNFIFFQIIFQSGW